MMSQLRYAIIVGLSQYEHLGDLGYVAGDVQLMQGTAISRFGQTGCTNGLIIDARWQAKRNRGKAVD